MIKNFFKTALRSLAKNKLSSFINIFGLSLAIGISLVSYIFIHFTYSMDRFHKNRERVFLLQNIVSRDGVEQVWGDSPAPIGAMMRQDFPQIEHVVRIDGSSCVFKYQDKVFNQFVRFVDPGFLDMFTFPLKYGSKDALNDPSKVILSKEVAVKYFSDKDPTGEEIELIMNEKKEAFTVGGVAEEFPRAASFRFQILINFEKKFTFYPKQDPDDWTDFITATFIQLHDPADIDVITSGMDKYVKLQNEAEEDWPASAYTFHPLTTLSLNSYQIRGDISSGDDPTSRIVLGLISAFLMTIACFNYVNIAIVSSAKRLKEIGIRKVVGGTKRQLISQFIGENLIICFLALVLGGIWARTLFAPWFDNQFDIGLELDFYKDITGWIFFTILLFVTGIVSGAYPAFYISSFSAVDIFRGKSRFGKKNRFTKVLLTFQFILSIITIVFGIIFTQNADYQLQRDWGYNQSQTLVVPVDRPQTFTLLKNEYLQNPDVLEIGGGRSHLGRSSSIAVIDINDTKYEIRRFGVGYNYLEAMGIRLKKGRFFEEQRATDLTESVVINETFAANMKWDNPLEQSFEVDSLTYQVIGVVEDFHYASFYNKIEPAFFYMSEPEDFNYIVMRTAVAKAASIGESIETFWREKVPDVPYSGFFQDSVFDNYFNNIQGHGRIMASVAVFAIILCCMGLFGLVSLNVAARMQEFSIRKVLGAGLLHIFKYVNSQYIWLILIAAVIGLPISYYLVKTLLDIVYRYHIQVTPIPMVLAILVLVMVSLITVSSLMIKVAKSNPVENLRAE